MAVTLSTTSSSAAPPKRVNATAALAVAAVIQTALLSPGAAAAVAWLLLLIAVAYGLSRTTGIPGLMVHPEPFDTLGTIVSLCEIAAAVVTVRPLIRRRLS